MQSNMYPELTTMLSSALLIELPVIGVFGDDEGVEMDESNIAVCMLKQSIESEGGAGLPLTVVGSCCRLNHRMQFSKENAFRLGASLGLLPTELRSIAEPTSWGTVFTD